MKRILCFLLVLFSVNAFAQGRVQRLSLIVSSQTCTSTGNGSAQALTVTIGGVSYVALTQSDPDGCALTLSESGFIDGQILTIVNISSNSATIADSSGVQELKGGSTITLAQYESATFIYRSDRWVESSRAATSGEALSNPTIQCVTLVTGLQRCGSTTTLTNAQVLALPTTGITLVAAQGASKRIQLIQAGLITNFSAGAYTNIGGTAPYIVLLLGTSEISTYIANDAAATPAQTNLTTFLSANARHVTLFPWSEAETTGGWGVVTPVTIVDLNQALSIKAVNDAAGNFTGGNAANTLLVYLEYYVVG